MNVSTILFRAKELKNGMNMIITPHNSDMEYLSYGRIFLNEKQKYSGNTENNEHALGVLSKECKITIGENEYHLENQDAVYLPKNTSYQLKKVNNQRVDLIVASAPSEVDTKPIVIKFNEVDKDPDKHSIIGSDPAVLNFWTMIGPEIKASRLKMGWTLCKPGNWSSFPPHEHTKTMEEIYVFYDVPEPSYAIQLVYENIKNPKVCTPIQQDDAIAIAKGYHPLVTVPGFEIKHAWLIAGKKSIEDRIKGINWQPGFEKQLPPELK